MKSHCFNVFLVQDLPQCACSAVAHINNLHLCWLFLLFLDCQPKQNQTKTTCSHWNTFHTVGFVWIWAFINTMVKAVPTTRTFIHSGIDFTMHNKFWWVFNHFHKECKNIKCDQHSIVGLCFCSSTTLIKSVRWFYKQLNVRIVMC